MSTFTVYCHGTAFNRRTDPNELITWLHNHTYGAEVKFSDSHAWLGTHLINEGPGSGGWDGIPNPVSVDPSTGNRDSSWNPLRGRTVGKISGTLIGAGWDENAERTVNIINELYQPPHNVNITEVNLAGWSRGGVTCIMIAELLHKVLPFIRCNIVAVDPVGGGTAGRTRGATITPNVAACLIILATGDKRKTFKPQDLSRLTVTNTDRSTMVMLPMPGLHDGQVLEGDPPEAWIISKRLVKSFLQHHRTQLIPFADELYNLEAICNYYGRLVQWRRDANAGPSLLTTLVGGGVTGAGSRSFTTTENMARYVHGGKESYWINEHHRACFQALYPMAYDKLFGSAVGPNDVGTIQPQMFAHLRPTDTVQSLVDTGIMRLENNGRYAAYNEPNRYGAASEMAWPAQWPLF
jgi:hypothetical protein